MLGVDVTQEKITQPNGGSGKQRARCVPNAKRDRHQDQGQDELAAHEHQAGSASGCFLPSHCK